MAADSPSFDVNGLMRQIREKASPVINAQDAVPDLGTHLSRLRMSAIELREAIRRAGQLPPSPPTLRGRFGGLVAAVMLRINSSQMDRTRAVQTAVATVLDEQSRLLEAMSANFKGLTDSIETLERQIAAERTQARQDRERFQALLQEEARAREELAAGCQSSLHRLEHALVRRIPNS
jgi:hypothetical protein